MTFQEFVKKSLYTLPGTLVIVGGLTALSMANDSGPINDYPVDRPDDQRIPPRLVVDERRHSRLRLIPCQAHPCVDSCQPFGAR